jgi:alpha-D-ribose 1-methylphosphonate 5-triphosphate diphosphatase
MIDLLDNVRALLPDGSIVPASISIAADGCIAEIAEPGRGGADAGGMLVLPGIVDLHGDAFERQLMPRPGVHFDAITALIDTDRQMLANGITTAYHGLTLSWEPGLRGIGAARAFLAALDAAKATLGCDTRVHLRFETYNLDCVEEVLGWIASGRIDLLAFNEHTRDVARSLARGKASGYLDRNRVTQDEFVALFERVRARAADVPTAERRLAAAAVAGNLPFLSHDDETPAERARYRALGCRICEFPFDAATAQAAIDAGDTVVMGAPNVIRGGSHGGRLGAAIAVGAGLCSVLTSDYYYPALPQAPFRLARDGVVPLAAAWNLVSRNPARAAGLTDRGELAPGQRADILLLDDGERPAIAATLVAGVPVFLNGALVSGLLHARQAQAVTA